jgi:hypothetical protein
MTYRELLNDLKQLSEEHLDDTVTVFDPYTEEFTAIVHGVECDDAVDVLDEGHYFMTLKA